MTALRAETVEDRIIRQAITGVIDEARLLPAADKRARDANKRLDRMAAGAGWFQFVAGAAFTILTGKAPARRNAEISVVREIARWRREVERFAPERIDKFDALIRQAINNPAAAPTRPAETGAGPRAEPAGRPADREGRAAQVAEPRARAGKRPRGESIQRNLPKP